MATVDRAGPAGRIPRLPTLAGYAARVRSNLVVVVATLAGCGGGLYLAGEVPAAFEASASIELPDVPTWVDTQALDPVPDRTTIDTTAQLVFSTPVFERVSGATGLTARQVESQLSVSAYPLSRVLIVTFEAATGDLAISGANTAARALVDQRAALLVGANLDAADALYVRLSGIRSKVRAKVAEFSPVARRITAMLDQIREVKQQSVEYGGRVVDRADPATRIGQHPELQVVTGTVVGFMVGILLARRRPSRRDQPDRRVIGVR